MNEIKVSKEIIVHIKTLDAKLISIQIKSDATFKQLLLAAIKDKKLSEVHRCQFCFNGKYLLNTGLDCEIGDLNIINDSIIYMQLAQQTSDKSTIWNLKNLEDQPVDNDITLSIWDFGDGKEVTKLSVKKTTTMRDIKKQLQQKYNLSDERINELYLSYTSYNMFYDLDLTVEQVCDREGSSKDIEKREVRAFTNGFDFNLKISAGKIEIDNRSENDSKNNKHENDVKANWKLIILGLLFFVGAVLAWYLGESWFLIGGLAFAGLVFFGLSFVWLKLKSCIGCTKIGILKKQENKGPVKDSRDLDNNVTRESDDRHVK